MVEVTRREKESSGSLLRRFTRKAQQAGVLLEVRRGRRWKKTPSSFRKKRSACNFNHANVVPPKFLAVLLILKSL